MKPKVVSLFAGIGGFDLGLERAGFEVVRQVEIDAYCLKVLEKHWPHVDRGTDVRKEESEAYAERYGAINLVCGGFPCFPAGTLVLCKDGLKPIEDVRVGDEVLTHTGVFRRVVRTVSRFANTIVLKGYGHPELVTTENHPFYASERARTYNSHRRGWDSCFSEPTWVFAKDMKRKYWASPVSFPQMDLPPISSEGREFENPPITPDLMWLVGVWLGDGWVRMRKTKGRAIICASYDQADILRSAIRAAGFDASESKERTVIKFHITRRAFARWLVEHFGQKAHGKTIPTWALGMSRELREALLMGYLFADGFPYKDGYKATTVSKPLAVGIKLLAQSLGWSVSLYRYQPNRPSVIEGRRVDERPQWRIVLRGKTRSAFIKNGNVFGLVRSVSPTGRKELVYDITVEADHSFLADGIVVHNCQDLSLAGRRAGLAGERSGLFFEFMRIVAELTPRWVLIENVPGLLSSNGGRDMGTVLGTLAKLGYGYAYRVLDAQFFGVAQRRRRVFIVGCLGDAASAVKVLFEPDCLPGNPPPSREKGQGVARCAPMRTRIDGETEIFVTQALTGTFGNGGADDTKAQAGFLVATTTTGGDTCANAEEARPREILRVLREAAGEKAFEEWAVGVLAALWKAEVLRPAVHGEVVRRAAHHGRSWLDDSASSCPKDGSSRPMFEVWSTRCIRRASQEWRLDGQQARELGAYLQELSQQGPSQEKALRDLWQASEGLGLLRQALSAVQEIRRPFKNQSQPAHSGYGVRRLTPTEAERLQGFPDGWTLLPDGNTPDSPRYRALGNAVAVPVAEWIGRRLMSVISEEAKP
jgi:site-specific DNA-cytosine methylase/intein/homing endonuclease